MSGQYLRWWAPPLLLVALLGALRAGNFFLQDLQYTQAQTEVSFWGRQGYMPTSQSIDQTSRAIESLLHRSPAHPGYLSLQANSYAWQSYWALDEGTTLQYAELALNSQGLALQSRPVHPLSQAKMVEYAARLQAPNN